MNHWLMAAAAVAWPVLDVAGGMLITYGLIRLWRWLRRA